MSGNDGSWPTSYIRYKMNSFVESPYWLAPEVFNGHYTDEADMLSLGVNFMAILERDFISINGKVYYGVFRNIRGVGKVGNGLPMAIHGADIDIENTAEDDLWCSLAVLAFGRVMKTNA